MKYNRGTALWVSLALLALAFCQGALATTYYTYDILGRVTQVVESDGTTTQYSYDANGNITSINRIAGTAVLSIGSVSTSTGATGTSVTITGSGFSSIASQDVVMFNGVAATVTYASGNRLVVTVPDGATSGDISITTQQGGSVTSSNSFTVVPVSVSSFSPATGAVGVSLTINGGGFDATPANNTVFINGVAATVSSATTTQLQVTVPSGATPGHITVTSPLGSGTSSGMFFLPAPNYPMTAISRVATLIPGGDGEIYAVGAGQSGVALFDCAAGQRMSMIATNLSVSGTYSVFAPDSSTLATQLIENDWPTSTGLPPCRSTGTYAWYFTPTSTPATATFSLQADVVGGLLVDGTATATSLAPGQSASYTFAGVAGQSYSLALTQFTGQSTVDASIFNPDGSLLQDCGVFQAYYTTTQQCDFTTASTATYTLRIVPNTQGNYASTFNTFVIADFNATLTAGTPGPTVALNLLPQQHGLLQFTAQANQTFALYFGPATITPGAGNLAQYNVIGVNGATAAAGNSATVNMPNIVAGSHSVRVDTFATGASLSTTATLANGVTATLPLNGSTAQFQTYVPGQAAYFTFAGTAGQSVGFAVTDLQLSPNTVDSVTIDIYKPDTNYLTAATCYAGTAPGCQVSLQNLSETGNYQVVVTPGGQAIMSLAMTASQDATGTLAMGSATAVDLTSAGQNGLYTFTLTGSEPVVIDGASISTSPAGMPVTIYAYNSSGAFLNEVSITGSSGALNLGILPAGTYTILVVPSNGATGSMTLALQPGANSTLTLNGPTVNLGTTTVGQAAYVSFAATPGQAVSLALSNLTFSPSTVTSANVTFYNPDNSTLWQTSCSAGAGCTLDARGLSQAGTYSVTITPNGSATMGFGATASANFMANLTTGTPADLALSLGQYATLTFTAIAGQSFALQVGGIATTPANAPVLVQVYNTANYGSVQSITTTQSSAALNLTNLAAGTYAVWIGPQTPATTTAQVTLTPPQTTAVPTDGSSNTISTSYLGQNAYMTFSATAGQSVDVSLTGLVLSPGSPGSVTWSITAPDGSSAVGSNGCSNGARTGCTGGIITVPLTGTYTINVVPQGQQTMSFAVTIAQNLTGALTLGTTQTLNLTEVGQAARFAFTVSSGQTLAVGMTGLTMTPSNNYYGMSIYTASGSYVTGFTTTISGDFNLSTLAAENLTTLAAGNYILWIGPLAPTTATMQLSLQPGVAPALPADGSSNQVATLAPGQYALPTFSGSAGQSIDVALTDLTMSPGSGGLVYWWVTAPDDTTVISGNYCPVGGATTCNAGVLSLPQTGTYTIHLEPGNFNSGSILETMNVTITIAQNVIETLTPGTPLALNLSVIGQDARLTFTIPSGGSLATATMSGLTTTPANISTWMGVYSTGGTLEQGGWTSTGETLNLSSLAPGTYYLWVGASAPGTASMQLLLQ